MMTTEEAKEGLGIGIYGRGLLYTDERSLPYSPQRGVHVGMLSLDDLELSLCDYGATRALVPLIKKHADSLRRRRGQVYHLTEQISVVLGTEIWLMRSAKTPFKRKKS